MISKILSRLRVDEQKYIVVDPRMHNDSFAIEIDWEPMSTRKKVVTSSTLEDSNFAQYRFKPVRKFDIGPLILLCFFGWYIYQLRFLYLDNLHEQDQSFGIIFMIVIISNLFRMFPILVKPIVFDKTTGVYWKGWKQSWAEKFGNSVSLKDIYALQIIPKEITYRKRGSIELFELNLILKNKKRLRVIDHENLKNLSLDADKLARFLGVPLWTGIKTEEN